MEIWTEVRRRVLTGELSKRAACKEYGLNWLKRKTGMAGEEVDSLAEPEPGVHHAAPL
jgi:hypothetical protein